MKMKKGIIAIALLLSGALLITPITTNANSTENSTDTVVIEEVNNTDKTEVSNELKDETTYKEDIQENTYKSETNNNQPIKVETTQEEIVEDINTSDEVVEEEEEEIEECGMTKTDAESVLNNYLSATNQSDITYAYQGDENTFEVITQKGIRGYVFLPNVDTDLAYLVDKDNGSIYLFHTSGYFELIQ